MAAIKNATSPSHSSLRSNKHGPPPLPPAAGQKSDRSVTVLSTESLPSYCSERYYLLSELHIKAACLLSFSDVGERQGALWQEGWAGADSSGESSSSLAAGSPTAADAVSIPAFLIVYLIWREDVSLDDFVEIVLADALTVCHDALTVVSSLADFTSLRGPPSSPPHYRHHFQQRLLGEQEHLKRTSLYVVVDRISSETEQAEMLAKRVAARFRNQCEGITVGISNRASPGLAACVAALELGATDRRKLLQEEKSTTIGIITDHREDLEESKQDFDAAVNVVQSRVCAEWNGNGNLESFAARAHSQWRAQQGLSPFFPPVPKRRIPRLAAPPTPPSSATTIVSVLTLEERKQIAIEQAIENRIFRDMLYDMGVYFVLMLFLVYHYREDILWLMDGRRIDDLVQYLRSI